MSPPRLPRWTRRASASTNGGPPLYESSPSLCLEGQPSMEHLAVLLRSGTVPNELSVPGRVLASGYSPVPAGYGWVLIPRKLGDALTIRRVYIGGLGGAREPPTSKGG